MSPYDRFSERHHGRVRRLGLLVRVRSAGHPQSGRRVDPVRTGSLARLRGARVPRRLVRVACGGLHRGRCRLRAPPGERRTDVGWGLPARYLMIVIPAHRHSACGGDSGGSRGACHVRAALGRLARLRRSRCARLRVALSDRRDAAHLRTAQHRSRVPGHLRPPPPTSFTLAPGGLPHRRRGSLNGARRSRGRVGTSPGSSCTGPTAR